MESVEETRIRQRNALRIALAANALFLVVELFGGIIFGSLALLADAAHMFSDVAALTIALLAQTLATRPGSVRHTYGYQRAEVLAAQANGLLLLLLSGWIAFEAIDRLGDNPHVSGAGMSVVALGGLIVNLVSAIVIARARGSSVNMRGAFIHLAADSASSVVALLAGIAISITGQTWFDPIASLAITVGVIWAATQLLRDVSSILLEAAPRGMDLEKIEDAILNFQGVESVHHIHVWNLASDVPALSAHVVIKDNPSLHDAQIMGNRLRNLLEHDFGIAHATLELECHECDD